MKNPCIGCKNNRPALRDACTICDARVAWVKFNQKDEYDSQREKVMTEKITLPQTKTCKICGVVKTVADFRRHSHSPDGYANTCNACRKPTPGRKPKKTTRTKYPAGSVTVADMVSLHTGVLSVNDIAARMDRDAISTTLSATQAAIAAECDAIKAMLLTKNAEYGDSAVNPVRIFSTADPTEQIRVRIDDKISRLRAPGKKTISEDTVADLIGYLILLRVAEKMEPAA